MKTIIGLILTYDEIEILFMFNFTGADNMDKDQQVIHMNKIYCFYSNIRFTV